MQRRLRPSHRLPQAYCSQCRRKCRRLTNRGLPVLIRARRLHASLQLMLRQAALQTLRNRASPHRRRKVFRSSPAHSRFYLTQSQPGQRSRRRRPRRRPRRATLILKTKILPQPFLRRNPPLRFLTTGELVVSSRRNRGLLPQSVSLQPFARTVAPASRLSRGRLAPLASSRVKTSVTARCPTHRVFAMCGLADGVEHAPEVSSRYFFVHWSTQSVTVFHQSCEFCGFRTQWPSSGK